MKIKIHNTHKKAFLTALITLICLGSLVYWIYSKFYVSTDDAYVNANIVQIAPRVTGQVEHLYIKNNQFVTAGQPLFDLDPALYQVAVDQAKAQLSMAEAKKMLAQNTNARTYALVKKNVASAQEGDDTQTNLQSAIAQVALDTANLAQAELNLSYTKVTAPTSGWVTNVTLRIGNIAPANQPLFALISNNEFWLDANFKETELEHLSPGQRADITVDTYPNHPFSGVVESMSGGSGSAFSLLPPENATGNWVKVTQRVPVRIRILNPDPKLPLRIGTSATATIWVRPWARS